jgi:hypothetical protein
MVSTLAMLIGPVVGGVIAQRSFPTAFGVAATIVFIGVGPTLLLDRPRPFARVGGHGYIELLRHPGVRLGMWASIAVGLWRGLLASYVPIALDAGGSTEATIGVVVAIANGAAIVGGYLAMRVDGSQVASATAWWSTITLISTAIVGYDLHASFIAIALTGGGMAIGLIQVLAITAVSEAVHPELQADAVTLAGVARGITLSGAPLGVAGMLVVTGLGPVVLVVTAVLVAPAAYFSGREARFAPSEARR